MVRTLVTGMSVWPSARTLTNWLAMLSTTISSAVTLRRITLVTVDENATESKVIIDNGARVGELNLDVATEVTGGGDIKNLNVAAPGCKVEMLPDKITIRPGITGNINGTEMDSVTAPGSRR